MTHSINPTRSSAALFTICVRCLMPLFFPLICIQFFELGASFRYIFEKKKKSFKCEQTPVIYSYLPP